MEGVLRSAFLYGIHSAIRLLRIKLVPIGIYWSYYKSIAGDSVKKFRIPSIPPTTNKCIRFPNDLITQVEDVIRGKGCTFSAFVIEAVRVALDNLEDE